MIKKTNTKEEILDAACRLMSLRGFHQTSLEDILRESRVGKGNFYYYFKSKEELGYAILERTAEIYREGIFASVLNDGSDPLRQIFEFLDRIVQVQRQAGCVGGCPIGNLALELSDLHEGFRQRLARIFEDWRDQIERQLEVARQQGQIDPTTDTRVMATFFLAGVEGGILLAKVTKNSKFLEECVAELKRHLVPLFEDRPVGPLGYR
jgi:TetR/AcrR family transcriptional repressor of nem operon